jgi:4-aminobutyrate aminotransferase
MPLSGMIARADLLESWSAGAHGSTYGGKPVACAAALATIRLLETGLVANAASRGEQLMRGLREIAAAHDGFVTDVRGRGLMVGVEFDSATSAEEVEWACFRRGLLVLECGKSTLRLAPALVVNEEEIDTALRILREAVASVSRGETAVSPSAKVVIAAHEDPVEAAV